MKKENLQMMLEALGKGGVTVMGDFVLEKHVENEVGNVENGGIGIQINHGRDVPMAKDDKEGEEQPREKPQGLGAERLAQAIEQCQEYFWGNSAYAVVFCVCRDDHGMEPNMSSFEMRVEMLPYKKPRSYTCPTGTLTNAFSNNKIYYDHVDKWDAQNPMKRIITLRDELRKALEVL